MVLRRGWLCRRRRAGRRGGGAAAGASLLAFVFLGSEAVGSSEAAALRVLGAMSTCERKVALLASRHLAIWGYGDPGSSGEKFLGAMCQAPKIFLASDVDATVERVAAGSHAWAALGVEGRLRHLHTLRSKLSRADFAAWTAGSIHAQGLDPNSDLGRAQQVAEMMTLSAVAAGELGRIADPAAGGRAGAGAEARPQRHERAGGVLNLPVTRYDKWCNPLALAGFSSEVAAPGAEATRAARLSRLVDGDGGRVRRARRGQPGL